MSTDFWFGVFVALIFIAGFGWGQWWAERAIRTDQAALTRGRLNVSMPMREENASQMLGLLRELSLEVEAERAAREQAQ